MITETLLNMNVSRETTERLREFEVLVQKWNQSINLISKQDTQDIWTRHIIDSAQFAAQVNFPDHWVDIGSGGGFPAIVLACLAAESAAHTHFTLVESDRRKCAFLLAARAQLDLSFSVLSDRIQSIAPLGADIISARALAPLSRLFDMSLSHMAPGAKLVFAKGKSYAQEIMQAKSDWAFKYQQIPSKTNPDSAILIIRNLKKC